MKRKTTPTGQPKTPSAVAVAAHRQTSAGPMGGTRRQQRRAERRSVKQALRAGQED